VSPASPWWRGAVLYQIYPRSFADSNGDGIGDLEGVRSRLDHLEWLGVDGIWLNPVHPSPNADWGYDVADYLGVHPDFGTLDDLDRLVAEAARRGIRVLLDLVPGHTSDRHSWFEESRSSRDNPRRGWYVWRDPQPGRAPRPPNNWRSFFGGPAWEPDTRTGQMYLHLFLPQQPDLNWWNDGVRDAFDDILRFWFDRGVAGFRIDVAHGVVKDRELRDNPTRPYKPIYNLNRPEVHDVHRHWRRVADSYQDQRVLLGETWVGAVEDLLPFYGRNDGLHMAFNFLLLMAKLRAPDLRRVVERTEALFPEDAWPLWTLSNHDVVRFPTRMCGGDEAKVRCALLTLLTLRGTPVLYYGDELGMRQVQVSPERKRDPAEDRDGARTPMPWGDVEWRHPWLPVGGEVRDVAAQREDPASLLSFCRRLTQLRREQPDLRTGPYSTLPAPPGVWAWRRGEGLAAAVNLSGRAVRVPFVAGRVLAATDGRTTDGPLRLDPWQGALVAG
jgi:alpha-glucosidase